MSWQSFLITIHLVGAVLGAGSSTFAEIFYIKFKRFLGGQLHPTSNSFFTTIFLVERVGIALLVLSGIGLLMVDGEALRTDPKLWAKLTIMFILLFDTAGWRSDKIPGLIWGALSLTSWYAALILGSLRDLTLSYGAIMILYVISIAVVAFVLNFIRSFLGIRTVK